VVSAISYHSDLVAMSVYCCEDWALMLRVYDYILLDMSSVV